jgi:hypothetical protein
MTKSPHLEYNKEQQQSNLGTCSDMCQATPTEEATRMAISTFITNDYRLLSEQWFNPVCHRQAALFFFGLANRQVHST